MLIFAVGVAVAAAVAVLVIAIAHSGTPRERALVVPAVPVPQADTAECAAWP